MVEVIWVPLVGLASAVFGGGTVVTWLRFRKKDTAETRKVDVETAGLATRIARDMMSELEEEMEEMRTEMKIMAARIKQLETCLKENGITVPNGQWIGGHYVGDLR